MDVAIARWRVRNQHLTSPHAGSEGEVMGTLLAVQAENASQSAWAVATRTTSPEPGHLAALLASGDVVRTTCCARHGTTSRERTSTGSLR